VSRAEDDEVTRRQFVGLVTLTSGGLFLGTAVIGIARSWRDQAVPAKPLRIGGLDDLPTVSLFSFPTAGEPCLLIRLGAERLVAYGQACTHLGCPVIYQAGARALHCPCHEGYFGVEDGWPLQGPPKRPLRKIVLRLRDDAVWATGVERS
jgi:Rieske Fe-S protein